MFYHFNWLVHKTPSLLACMLGPMASINKVLDEDKQD
jgi:hypothetical protein